MVEGLTYNGLLNSYARHFWESIKQIGKWGIGK